MYPIRVLCSTLRVSTSGYYRYLKQPASIRQQANTELVATIRSVHSNTRGVYGSRRLTAALRQQGHRCSRHRVRRLMKDAKLAVVKRKPFVRTTDSDHHKASPNLLKRQFHVTSPNYAWTGDITYVYTQEGWLFVATVMDLYSRTIVGLATGEDLSATLVVEAMMQAIRRRQPPPGLLFHSDRGVQYSSRQFRSILQAHSMTQSMSRKGNCWDNAPMESFFKSMKTEMRMDVQPSFVTREEAEQAVFDYIEIFYNRQRIHSALNYQSPLQFEVSNNLNQTIASTPTVY